MEKRSYVVAIDLGSSNVVVAVGTKTPEGMAVEAVVSKPVEGVNAGRIDNIEQVAHAITTAVDEVSAQMGIHITDAYAGISGQFVRCACYTDYVFTDDKINGVSQSDVDRLFDRMRNVQAPDEELIMERIPLNYMVDNDQEVQNPVGSFGKKLSSTFNFILCARTPMQRLELALKRCGIHLMGIFANAQVTPDTVISPEEKEEGVVVVDLGSGLTDVSIYYRNVLRYVATIPMGASAINRDIRSQSIPEKHVEKLKCAYGSAVAELAPEDKLIRVSGRTAREAKDILLRNLATVVEARATDMVEFVMQEIRDSGLANKLPYGIVLTGGAAQLKDIDELFRRITKMDVRIAAPEEGLTEESKEKMTTPAYAAVIGILLRGAEKGFCGSMDYMPAKPTVVEPVLPTQPTQPTQPVRPAQPVQPTRPVQPVNPRPVEPARPVTAQAPKAVAVPIETREEVETLQEETYDQESNEQQPSKRLSWKDRVKGIFENINTKFEKAGDDDEEI